MTLTCTHRWQLEPPEHGMVLGQCCYCHVEQTWEEQTYMDQFNGRVSTAGSEAPGERVNAGDW